MFLKLTCDAFRRFSAAVSSSVRLEWRVPFPISSLRGLDLVSPCWRTSFVVRTRRGHASLRWCYSLLPELDAAVHHVWSSHSSRRPKDSFKMIAWKSTVRIEHRPSTCHAFSWTLERHIDSRPVSSPRRLKTTNEQVRMDRDERRRVTFSRLITSAHSSWPWRLSALDLASRIDSANFNWASSSSCWPSISFFFWIQGNRWHTRGECISDLPWYGRRAKLWHYELRWCFLRDLEPSFVIESLWERTRQRQSFSLSSRFSE